MSREGATYSGRKTTRSTGRRADSSYKPDSRRAAQGSRDTNDDLQAKV